MKCDVSIIVASKTPSNLVKTLDYIYKQNHVGLSFEIIIIQESDDGFSKFNIIKCPLNAKIIRQKLSNDYGALAHDIGVINSIGEFVVFWDDDNLYYPHALVTQYVNTNGYDIGIARIKHRNGIIPIDNKIVAGDIDTMCLCVRRDLAITAKWNDGGGRYSDYRWISKIITDNQINYTKIIIGEHL